MEYLSKVVLSVILCSSSVLSYSGGPPTTVCTSMTPGHGVAATSNSGSPFQVTVSKSTYSPGETLTVTVSSTTAATFVGFMLQAREVGGTKPIGEFLGTFPAKTKIIDCSSSNGADPKGVVVHNNPGKSKWTTLSFNWKAPNPDVGDIKFRVTVVKELIVFYVGLESNTITSSGTSTIAPTATAAVVPSSTASVPTIPSIDTEYATSDCGKTKGCLLDSSLCTSVSSCNYLLTFTADENLITFELSGKATGWVAVGFNDAKRMEGGDVLACVQRSGTVTIDHYVNKPGYSPEKSAKAEGVTLLSSAYSNGIIKCRFTRQKNTTDPKTRDLKNSWYLLAARGQSVDAGSGKIKHHSWKMTSTDKVDVSKVFVVGSESISIALLQVHACLMIIAWLGCAGTGIIFARFLRNVWGDFLGLKLWFQVHRAVMGTAVVLSIIAITCVFVHVKAWSPGLHPILGIIVVCLATIQPVIAFFRPHPGEANRAVFTWVHRSIAIVAFVLSLVTIFTGLKQPALNPGDEAIYALVIFIVVFVILCISLEVSTCITDKKNSQAAAYETDSNKEQGVSEMKPEVTPSHSDFGIRKGVLAMFLLVMVGVVLTLVVLVASKDDGSN